MVAELRACPVVRTCTRTPVCVRTVPGVVLRDCIAVYPWALTNCVHVRLYARVPARLCACGLSRVSYCGTASLCTRGLSRRSADNLLSCLRRGPGWFRDPGSGRSCSSTTTRWSTGLPSVAFTAVVRTRIGCLTSAGAARLPGLLSTRRRGICKNVTHGGAARDSGYRTPDRSLRAQLLGPRSRRAVVSTVLVCTQAYLCDAVRADNPACVVEYTWPCGRCLSGSGPARPAGRGARHALALYRP